MAQRVLQAGLMVALALVAAVGQGVPAAGRAEGFRMDAAGVVARSTVILERPNLDASEAMPLGNGRLGVAVWAASGMTVQLNRADTMPRRLALGQVTVPGLEKLTAAADFHGELDLYDGELRERGGGMSAVVYVEAGSDQVVIAVTGADPGQMQTAELQLWPPRMPEAMVHGNFGMLAEDWLDSGEPGASGRRFGSLAAVTADGKEVSVARVNALTVRISFRPLADGSYRLRVGGPGWNGEESGLAAAERSLRKAAASSHALWWHAFWKHTGLIRMDSADGSAEYMENLRALYLFCAAAGRGEEWPGSQAGIADLFSAVRDAHNWDPAAFWHWNLRMQVAANLSAGHAELNAPYFSLYRNSLAGIENWTRQHMAGRPGICVPETMRFNGVGIEYETWNGPAAPVIGLNCDAGSKPYYNARTLSTGGEVALWVWQQYLFTGDGAFLAENYPLLREASRFLLAYEQSGADGLRHTSPSNAHETQWDSVDPTTDLAVRRTLYPETIAAATLLHRDPELVAELKAEARLIPALPRTGEAAKELLAPEADHQGEDVIAESAVPGATQHNVENIGLEPVWPYGLIGDDSPLTELARRTYMHRPYPTNQDWSNDPIQAARLGLGSEVSATLIHLTETYQIFSNGMASWSGKVGEFYIEQSGMAAAAIDEALAQDFDGVLRIAPAVPPGWDFAGSVFLHGRNKVFVQTNGGTVQRAVFEAGSTGEVRVRDPWGSAAFEIVDERTGAAVRAHGGIAGFAATAGHSYAVRRTLPGKSQVGLGVISGSTPAHARRLGERQIGLAAGGR